MSLFDLPELTTKVLEICPFLLSQKKQQPVKSGTRSQNKC